MNSSEPSLPSSRPAAAVIPPAPGAAQATPGHLSGTIIVLHPAGLPADAIEGSTLTRLPSVRVTYLPIH